MQIEKIIYAKKVNNLLPKYWEMWFKLFICSIIIYVKKNNSLQGNEWKQSESSLLFSKCVNCVRVEKS